MKKQMTGLLCLTMLTLVGCSSYKQAGGGDARQSLEAEAQTAIERFRSTDPTLQEFFDSSAGYVVFPKVSKGAAGVGGAHGNGVVYQKGQAIGYSDLTQATIGLQLGGQTYSEIIFFEHQLDLDRFKQGNAELSAQASAVAAESGAASNADYAEGVAVFTMTRAGLMFEASVGGQKFSYVPK